MKQYNIGDKITLKPNLVTPGLYSQKNATLTVRDISRLDYEIPRVHAVDSEGRSWEVYLEDIANSKQVVFNQKYVDSLRIEGSNQRVAREIANRLVEIRDNASRDDDKNLREITRLVREIRLLKKNIK